MLVETTEWLGWAIEVIKQGKITKLENENVIVYRCGTIIRIDIKGVFKS